MIKYPIDYLPTRETPDYNGLEVQSILDNLSGVNNLFESNQWLFIGSTKTTINFNDIEVLCENNPDWANTLQFDIVLITKLLLIYTCKDINSVYLYRLTFDAIVKTYYFMAANSLSIINKSHLESYLHFLLMHELNIGKINKRLTPISYKRFNSSLNICEWRKILRIHGVNNTFFAFYSKKLVIDSLKRCIKLVSDGDLTYCDWKEGGNFNYLTLDYGQYYIEHCFKFFEDNLILATSLRLTLSKSMIISQSAGLNRNLEGVKRTIKPIISHYLLGGKPHQLKDSYMNKISYDVLKKVYYLTKSTFESEYRALKLQQELLSNYHINKIASKIKICTSSFFKIERLRLYVEEYLLLKQQPFKSNVVFDESQKYTTQLNILDDNINTDKDKLNKLIDSICNSISINIEPKIPDISFYQKLGLKLNNSFRSTYLYEYMSQVEDSGIISFCALTGWRISEYGFSLSDIVISRNNDLLDQQSFPLRYEVNWIVPKTNGKTKLKREISYAAYNYAKRISLLTLSGKTKPFLYKLRKDSIDLTNGSNSLKNTISSMWAHYVKYYEPFVNLDKYENLLAMRDSSFDYTFDPNYNLLLEQSRKGHWEKLAKNTKLCEARRRSRLELKRIQFYIEKDNRRNFIIKYLNNSTCQHNKLLDKYLSSETKLFLKKLDKSDITSSITRSVANEIINGCYYPTQHAFRHMWAEAVYRRFDGDVGWMIRSSFKHISHNMWLAYIRNKDNRRQHDKAKRRVISSLLNNYVDKAGVGFAGSIDKLIQRLINTIKIVNINELDEFIKDFGNYEICDIKSNPWGYCLLQRRSLHRAKCAVQGIPQRHNASPSFCLGCCNNLTQHGNIEGILLNISNDLKVLNTKGVPTSFSKASYRTVIQALNNLSKLGLDKESLIEINSTLNTYKNRKESLC